MAVDPLSSNVVNYLIWRYLQEAGYAQAALALQKDWVRKPDELPFAKNVQRRQLVDMLQDGQWWDKEVAIVTNRPRKWVFGTDHGSPYCGHNGAHLTLDKGIPAHELAEQANGAVQEPAPRKPATKKRTRKTNGVEPRLDPQTNGDAMDVDQNGATHVTNSVRAESEAVASEAGSSVDQIPISTLHIGQSAEVQTVPKPQELGTPVFTTFSSIKEPDKTVKLSQWGPPEAPVFLTAGKSLLRLYLFPKNHGVRPDEHQPLDLKVPLKDFTVTALSWDSQDQIVLSAREETVNEKGEIMKTDKLMKLLDGGTTTHQISSTAGIVHTIRFNKATQSILTISTDGNKGSIKIWKDDHVLPSHAAFTETAILDAAWIGDSTFVICGDGIFRIYGFGQELEVRRTFDTEAIWEHIKFDPESGIIAALTPGDEDSKSLLGIVHPNEPAQLHINELPSKDYPQDLAFRPRPRSSSTDPTASTSPVILATGSHSGEVRIWDANRPQEEPKKLVVDGEPAVYKLAFSPDGTRLATAGPDSLSLWNMDILEDRDTPVAVWNWNGRTDEWDPRDEGDFSLGWDPREDSEGGKLTVALGNQIAIIRTPRDLPEMLPLRR